MTGLFYGDRESRYGDADSHLLFKRMLFQNTDAGFGLAARFARETEGAVWKLQSPCPPIHQQHETSSAFDVFDLLWEVHY
jgi:hypothetical protein